MVAVPGRALRTSAAAGVAVAVAAVAHRAGGGAVDLAGACWVVAALAGPAWWLSGRERGWLALAGAQLVGQQAAHVVLAQPGDLHGGGLLPMDLMLHAHLAAAAVCALWLRWGERRAFAAVREVVRTVLLAVAAGGVPVPVAPAQPPSAPPALAAPALVLRHTLARRGPPLPAV